MRLFVRTDLTQLIIGKPGVQLYSCVSYMVCLPVNFASLSASGRKINKQAHTI